MFLRQRRENPLHFVGFPAFPPMREATNLPLRGKQGQNPADEARKRAVMSSQLAPMVIYPRHDGKTLTFNVDEVIAALQRARDALLGASDT